MKTSYMPVSAEWSCNVSLCGNMWSHNTWPVYWLQWH